jgi:hypothetical protein
LGNNIAGLLSKFQLKSALFKTWIRKPISLSKVRASSLCTNKHYPMVPGWRERGEFFMLTKISVGLACVCFPVVK